MNCLRGQLGPVWVLDFFCTKASVRIIWRNHQRAKLISSSIKALGT